MTVELNIAAPPVFQTREDIKNFLYEYNLRNQRKGKIKQSSSSLFLMKCISESCSFCFKAVKNKNCLFEVKISIAHNCTLQINCVKSTLVANCFKNVSSAVSDLTPRDCISYMQSAHGITASYHRAYAGMRLLNKEKAQSDEQSFALIEPWLNQMVLIQKGTKADYCEKLSRRKKTCSLCAQQGHDKRNAPRNPALSE
ncbi:hypothetical protein ENBRE01_1807 [Enteropsectra breve]|nr:hypothetical protein ENBRE01_1807 [Enteropsectra breve]